MNTLVAENILCIQKRIKDATQNVGRDPKSVQLVAVSKHVPVSKMQDAIAAGQYVFGENYVQPAISKFKELADSRVRFHLIGPLQRNKVKLSVGFFEMIQSVHRKEVAESISDTACALGIKQQILVQVNISEEESKSGVRAEALPEFCQEILSMPGLSLEGLMSIGRNFVGDNTIELKTGEFLAMSALRKETEASLGYPLKHLSMGMSEDYELAIACGATIIRVGSAVFGERSLGNDSVNE